MRGFFIKIKTKFKNMSNNQPSYEELLLENERLRQLVSEKTNKDISLINSSKTFHDLTEIKKTAERQEESEEKFRLFSEISPVGIFVTDIEGKTIYWNEKLDESQECLLKKVKE